ncbi:MAG TPA: Crp/Fnr family transcriptional regulator [Puia sp.]|jgi:CRP-like cAMP-binding protein|nr:Crp/Fnr family transcriptional regulator [Puia sp.]
MNHFIEVIAQCIPGETGALELIKPYIQQRSIPKNEFLLQAGAICKKVSFLHKGACYMYRDMGEKEEVTEFYFEGMLNSDYVSFIRQQPSEHYIRALEDMEVEEFSYTDLQYLYNNVPPSNKVGRLITERLYCGIITRMLSYQNDSPEVRYQKLTRERPELLQRVPQYLIASFLGVTPVGLSKIRKRLHDHGQETG